MAYFSMQRLLNRGYYDIFYVSCCWSYLDVHACAAPGLQLLLCSQNGVTSDVLLTFC